MKFEVIHSEKAYLGRAFDVRKDQVRMPDGQPKQRDVVEHNPSVVLVPVDDDGQIMFVRQHRYPVAEYLLELPAGVIEAGESPLSTAQREIREEIGMAAEELVMVGEFYLAPGYSTELMYVFMARGLSDDPLPADDDEFISVETLSIKNLYDQSMLLQFRDAKTLAALFLARPYFQDFISISN